MGDQAIFCDIFTKEKIRSDLHRLYCCYGNLLSKKYDNNLFANVWESVFYYPIITSGTND